MSTSDQRGGRNGRQAGQGTRNLRNLWLRVASAVVLAPVVLACAYVGGWLFSGLWVLAAAGILWEWTSLTAGYPDPRVLAPGYAGLLAAFLLVGANESGAAAMAIFLAAVLAGVLAATRRGPEGGSAGLLWAAGGVVYAGVAYLGPALLRRDPTPHIGFTALLLLFATVWASDIFAYVCGRAIGGPRLWPRLSPNKTWAGAAGGLAGGVIAATAVAYASGFGRLGIAAMMGLTFSVLAQAGDLLESAIKRRFGAKDAGRLIPGHGGLMDRLDGFLIAAFAALIFGILRQGTGAPASGLLLW